MKRNEKDIWANLFEFILRESPNQQMQTESTSSRIIQSIVGSSQFKIQSISPFFRQQLTHQTIHGQFIMVIIEKPLRNKTYELVPEAELNNYPFPKLINAYLEQR
jgi:A/G-specific adenine glycosylase